MTTNIDQEKLLKALVVKYSIHPGTWYDTSVRSVWLNHQDLDRFNDWKLEVTECNDPWQLQVSVVPVPAQERRALRDELAHSLDAVLDLEDRIRPGFSKQLADKLLALVDDET